MSLTTVKRVQRDIVTNKKQNYSTQAKIIIDIQKSQILSEEQLAKLAE